MPLRIVHATTVALSMRSFLFGHLEWLRDRGHDVWGVCDGADGLALPGVRFAQLEMPRRIVLRQDALALASFVRLLRRLRPDVVHLHTPKAALLGTIAARIARVPVVLYTVHGLVHSSRHGASRRLLAAMESVPCRLADRVWFVSPSLRDYAVDHGICSAAKATVAGAGSIAGVDAERFRATPAVQQRAAEHRASLGIPRDAPVLGFAGRLGQDKGRPTLVESWSSVRAEMPEARLLIVGSFENGDAIPIELRDRLENDPRVHRVDWQDDIVPWLAVMDVLALPSHREGFGLALLEAAALGIPTIASRIPGCIDAVADGVTGTLVRSGDPHALARASLALLRDPLLRRRMGVAGRKRACTDFRPVDRFATVGMATEALAGGRTDLCRIRAA
jgi:glycosyltransferase involved in cell wall biosynthesis